MYVYFIEQPILLICNLKQKKGSKEKHELKAQYIQKTDKYTFIHNSSFSSKFLIFSPNFIVIHHVYKLVI